VNTEEEEKEKEKKNIHQFLLENRVRSEFYKGGPEGGQFYLQVSNKDKNWTLAMYVFD
jgi:hypothetical protein